MAFTRHFYRNLNLVFTQVTGTIDDQSLLIHIMSLQADSGNYHCIREMVDARDLRNTDGLTVQGCIRIAEKHRELFPGKEFLAAVLVNSSEIGKIVDVYASLAGSMNLKVKAFDGALDDPLAWLGYEYRDRTRIKRLIGKHSKVLP